MIGGINYIQFVIFLYVLLRKRRKKNDKERKKETLNMKILNSNRQRLVMSKVTILSFKKCKNYSKRVELPNYN
jgi:hypothetical protein